ncbi:PepSY domain-containing protein [Roseomonas sp. HJA6]|uniref:PepSY domain-containing protein n=1 Tax=Roseomonas alba TaxID=2846776 RepID=A0ABS7A7L0_9PROT|nr:PepSY domain-containing protein [Neoroseomonas alba]MBW6397310.1 PepSY domain-containing protein [Neoroseomonas alba]
MKRHLPITALSLTLLAAPALADSTACRSGITAEEAIRIAREAGIAWLAKVECDDGRWEVEGRDASDRRIEVKVNPVDGRVVQVERGR